MFKPAIPTKCPKGVWYPSQVAMCKAYKINHSTYICRLKAGWTMEQALQPMSERWRKQRENGYKPVEDHKGKRHKTFAAMCRAYDQDPKYVKGLLDKGKPLEVALTTLPRSYRV